MDKTFLNPVATCQMTEVMLICSNTKTVYEIVLSTENATKMIVISLHSILGKQASKMWMQ